MPPSLFKLLVKAVNCFIASSNDAKNGNSNKNITITTDILKAARTVFVNESGLEVLEFSREIANALLDD